MKYMKYQVRTTHLESSNAYETHFADGWTIGEGDHLIIWRHSTQEECEQAGITVADRTRLRDEKPQSIIKVYNARHWLSIEPVL